MAIRTSHLRNRAPVETGVHSTLPFRTSVVLDAMRPRTRSGQRAELSADGGLMDATKKTPYVKI
jgi:hypothetical protein